MKIVKSNRLNNEPFFFQFFSVLDENGEPKFPLDDLTKLEEQVNRVRWIVPVLADGELIKCLRAAVRLARKSRTLFHRKFILVVVFFLLRTRYQKRTMSTFYSRQSCKFF